MLQEDLQIALRQFDELKARSSELEVKILLAGAGKRETVSGKQNLQSVRWPVTHCWSSTCRFDGEMLFGD